MSRRTRTEPLGADPESDGLTMDHTGGHPVIRSFVPYAAATLVPVLLLGAILAVDYRTQAQARGLARGRAEAVVIAETAVEPTLDWHPLNRDIPVDEKMDLQRLVARAVRGGSILRLRLRNLAGQVVYSDDGSGFAGASEDEAMQAARGAVVAKLTHLNGDSNDRGAVGVSAVEVYQPLTAGHPVRRVGVLELYLPYAPIQRDVSAGMHTMYQALVVGLVSLYLVLLLIAASVTRRLRRQLARNEFLAGHDPLTALPNRLLFHDRGRAALAKMGLRSREVAVAIVDLDRFQEVNDTLGHTNGDHLLTTIGSRLNNRIRTGDTIARLGGDEFGIVLRDAHDVGEALGRLRQVIGEELEVSGLPLTVEASIGYAVAPEDGSDIDTLMQRADVALYHAKRQHLGVVRYEQSQDNYDPARLGLLAELRHAISQGHLVLHYQPKIRLATGATEAVEALVRWQHPLHGLMYPDQFLPLVEQTDLIDELTAWVLRRALTDLAALPREDVAVAVNVSARNLVRPGFAAVVREAIAAAGVPSSRLLVELTETSLLIDPVRAGEALAELASIGIRASIDDFGRGQTSLGYLSALPVAEIKIDKSFVSDMATDPPHAAIVRSIVELGHNLGLEVVAEGVESDQIVQRLLAVGCDVAQGYHYARPMPVSALLGWLDESLTPVDT